MSLHIEQLQVTVRVKTRSRAAFKSSGPPQENRVSGQRTLLLPPPAPKQLQNLAQAALQVEEEPEAAAWAAENVDVTDLADRVFDFMKHDLRTARERSGR